MYGELRNHSPDNDLLTYSHSVIMGHMSRPPRSAMRNHRTNFWFQKNHYVARGTC